MPPCQSSQGLDLRIRRVDNGRMEFMAVEQRVTVTGLALRGGFYPVAADGLPSQVRTVVLVGDLGGRLWPYFNKTRRDEPDPLDNWTRRVLGVVASDLGAGVLYPFDGPPYHPFQQWAVRAEGLQPSPIGPLMHPEYGLWHSYRGALLFKQALDLPPAPEVGHPCAACRDRPCLSACPVNAFQDGADFNLDACLGHLGSPAGTPCMTGGCRARNACPVARDHAYGPDHQAFLARGFVSAFGS